MRLIELKLARHSEIQLLKMAGYEVLGRWSDTFVLMKLRHEEKP